jgi:hypothetical protein
LSSPKTDFPRACSDNVPWHVRLGKGKPQASGFALKSGPGSSDKTDDGLDGSRRRGGSGLCSVDFSFRQARRAAGPGEHCTTNDAAFSGRGVPRTRHPDGAGLRPGPRFLAKGEPPASR